MRQPLFTSFIIIKCTLLRLYVMIHVITIPADVIAFISGIALWERHPVLILDSLYISASGLMVNHWLCSKTYNSFILHCFFLSGRFSHNFIWYLDYICLLCQKSGLASTLHDGLKIWHFRAGRSTIKKVRTTQHSPGFMEKLRGMHCFVAFLRIIWFSIFYFCLWGYHSEPPSKKLIRFENTQTFNF